LPRPGQAKRGVEGPIGYLLRQAQAALRVGGDRALEAAGLTLPQYGVLRMLSTYGELSASDIARLSVQRTQTAHEALGVLERRGLVQRRAHESHQRIVVYALTGAAVPIVERAHRRVSTIETELVRGLSAAEEAFLRRWLVAVAQRYLNVAGPVARKSRTGVALKRRQS
jgi:DNA-binding MarR family transcriptional regulator